MNDDPTRRMPSEPDPAPRPRYESEPAPYEPGAPVPPGGGGDEMSTGVKAAIIALVALVVGLGVALAFIVSDDGTEPETTTVERTTTEPATTTTATETVTAPATTTTATITETTTETTTETVEDGAGP